MLNVAVSKVLASLTFSSQGNIILIFSYDFKFHKSEIKVVRVYVFLFPEGEPILGWLLGISFEI